MALDAAGALHTSHKFMARMDTCKYIILYGVRFTNADEAITCLKRYSTKRAHFLSIGHFFTDFVTNT